MWGLEGVAISEKINCKGLRMRKESVRQQEKHTSGREKKLVRTESEHARRTGWLKPSEPPFSSLNSSNKSSNIFTRYCGNFKIAIPGDRFKRVTGTSGQFL